MTRHASHHIHQHSREAYYAERDKLGKRAQMIRDWIVAHGPATDRDVMRWLGFSEPGAVRPRITELIGIGALEECGSIKCGVTGKTVRLVRATDTQKQMVL